METRSFRSKILNTGNTLEGYGVVFDSTTTVTERGQTFNECVTRDCQINYPEDVLACFNHDDSKLLGRMSSGTLRLSRDDHGIKFAIDLPDTPTGNEVRTLVERGDIQGASFRFAIRTNGAKWDRSTNTKYLTALDVFEIGPVTLPYYTDTSLKLRSKSYYVNKLRCLEKS